MSLKKLIILIIGLGYVSTVTYGVGVTFRRDTRIVTAGGSQSRSRNDDEFDVSNADARRIGSLQLRIFF